MQRTHLFLIVGIIAGVITVASIAGGLAVAGATRRDNISLTLLTLSLTPIPVRIEVISTTDWNGTWYIGSQGNSESGVFGTYNFNGTIAGTEKAMGIFAFNNLAGGSITVNIYINGQLMQSSYSNVHLQQVSVNQNSPYINLIPLAFIIGDMTVYG